MRNFLQRFMAGRYGSDQLSRFMLIIALAVLILYMFTGWFAAYVVAMVILFINIFRTFSRNISARYAENSRYLQLKYKVKQFFKGGSKNKTKSDPDHIIFKCPKCKQKVRVPKGRGRISIACPKCGNEFIKRT